MIMQARCIKCGRHYCGWALTVRTNRTCQCGGKLKIIKPRQLENNPFKGNHAHYHAPHKKHRLNFKPGS